jgi:hypothetical protein
MIRESGPRRNRVNRSGLPDRRIDMLDLEPATRMLAGLVAGVRDDQLGVPTPCHDANLGDLLDHVDGLSLAFTASGQDLPERGLPGAHG